MMMMMMRESRTERGITQFFCNLSQCEQKKKENLGVQCNL
jgi:hypothetical protein